MPVYTYRREDGTTFDIRQSFSDDALTVDPATGQQVVRVVQPAVVVFKGSGFYVNDSRGASKSSINGSASNGDSGAASEKSEAKAEAKTESKPEVKPAAAD